MSEAEPDWTALILSGGQSTRLGQDKASAILGERSLLDHVVDAIPAAVTCVVVGRPPSTATRLLIVAIEDEPDGGPVAGIDCGITLVRTPLVLLHAVDMPFTATLVPHLLAELRAAGPTADAVVPIDDSGRRQPLAAAYRTQSLIARLADLEPARGRSMRDLLAGLNVIELPVGDDNPHALLDIDTAADLDAARRTVTGDDNATTEETR